LWSEEGLAEMRPYSHEWVLHGSCKVTRDWGKQEILPVQRVARRQLCEDDSTGTKIFPGGCFKEDAAVSDVPDDPAVSGGGGGDEGEGEVTCEGDDPSCQRGGVRRVHGVEDIVSVLEEAEEGRVVEPAVLPEEGAAGDEAAECDAGGGGEDEVGWVVNAAEDVQQELLWDRRRGNFPGTMQPQQRMRRGLGLVLEDGRLHADLPLVRRAAGHPAADSESTDGTGVRSETVRGFGEQSSEPLLIRKEKEQRRERVTGWKPAGPVCRPGVGQVRMPNLLFLFSRFPFNLLFQQNLLTENQILPK
jgi:hypothetical protein